MIKTVIKKVFGSRNQRLIKQMSKVVARINALESTLSELDDKALAEKTHYFRKRYASGATLDELLPQAFAVVREASKRALGLRHFDVQLIGGMVLHHGKIAEMRTGEGKTLAATLPAYLNAIAGKGVHIVTVNDYLAKRDAKWMMPVYQFLGLTVGVNLATMSLEEKQKAYAADITYGTNNEFGFDYLRDNMAFTLEDKVQRSLYFAIVDEVDSILIDEARTPLIISGPVEESVALYHKINTIIPYLNPCKPKQDEGDFYLDEKNRQAFLTEKGHQHVEQQLIKIGLLGKNDSLYDSKHISLNHYLNAALRAHALYQRDVDYLVRENEVIIVDEHTGRTMPGRRWSEGLHQAIEAKEGVTVQQDNQTLASITFQNYFRLYDKLAGMTGTADTEAFEFQQIYNLEVVVIPTNKPMVRHDYPDKIYLTAKSKFNAIINDIKACHKRSQPVLVGTAAVETSEYLSKLLKKAGICHQVLNAKHHDREATIIAQAGRLGAVTIATNMAGRGTDIVLGGNWQAQIETRGKEVPKAKQQAIKIDWQTQHEQVLKAGGLAVIGSERHESRRIDNQLRGRAGRQGDAGSSRFYLSLEDHLMRIFASPRLAGLMQKLGMKENEAIEHSWVTKAIESAQRRVEGFHFDVRKQLLEYDDIASEQRGVIYQRRNQLLKAKTITKEIVAMRQEVVDHLVDNAIPETSLKEQWDLIGLQRQLQSDFACTADLTSPHHLDRDAIYHIVLDKMAKSYQAKEKTIGKQAMWHLEKAVMLQSLDNHWREHLNAMDHLRQGIHLRGYAQKDPKQEYQREAFELFMTMLEHIKYDVIKNLAIVEVPNEAIGGYDQAQPMDLTCLHGEFSDSRNDKKVQEQLAPLPKVGRNDPCYCGSGKKYKHCHGQLL